MAPSGWRGNCRSVVADRLARKDYCCCSKGSARACRASERGAIWERCLGYSAVHWFLIVLFYLWVARAFGGNLGRTHSRWRGAGARVYHGRLGRASSRRGRRSTGRDVLVLTLVFGVETSRRDGGNLDLAAYVCVVLSGGIAAAVPRRLVHGRTAADGERGRKSRRSGAARRNRRTRSLRNREETR